MRGLARASAPYPIYTTEANSANNMLPRANIIMVVLRFNH